MLYTSLMTILRRNAVKKVGTFSLKHCYLLYTAIPKVTNGTFADMQIGITDGS